MLNLFYASRFQKMTRRNKIKRNEWLITPHCYEFPLQHNWNNMYLEEKNGGGVVIMKLCLDDRCIHRNRCNRVNHTPIVYTDHLNIALSYVWSEYEMYWLLDWLVSVHLHIPKIQVLIYRCYAQVTIDGDKDEANQWIRTYKTVQRLPKCGTTIKLLGWIT